MKEYPSTELNECHLLDLTSFGVKGHKVFVQRDDLVDNEVSGNKWFKLKYHFLAMQKNLKKGILTFGGAYSNHLAATAAFGKHQGIPTIGLVRGDELSEDSNATLRKASSDGMRLVFLERSEYKLRDDREYLKALRVEYPDYQIVPEGGGGLYGLQGTMEMGERYRQHETEWDEIWVSVGTGVTSLGIALSNPKVKVNAVNCVGKSVDETYLNSHLRELGMQLEDVGNYELHTSAGQKFGKWSVELDDYIKRVEVEAGLNLEPVYTAKTFQFMVDFLRQKDQNQGLKILFVHTGGMQGYQK